MSVTYEQCHALCAILYQTSSSKAPLAWHPQTCEAPTSIHITQDVNPLLALLCAGECQAGGPLL